MAKKRTLFECQACGYQSLKWLGKCPNCGAWDQFLEPNEKQIDFIKKSSNTTLTTSNSVKPITQIKEESFTRVSTNDSELDLVLGGGVVEGSLVLIGGSPGVGKSTLLLKIASNLAKDGHKVLYVSGEESLGQIKIRANRLEANEPNLYLLAEISLQNLLNELQKESFSFLIVDSIQTLYSEELSAAPGSVSQVRAITFELMRFAKQSGCATFIIGHITKEGSIAGPRVLEHMVDTVLYFEGDSSKELRLLRGIKNRFGSTSDIGIFEMSERGLISAKDISKKFFSSSKKSCGSAITVILEGSRPIILEVQALVAECGYTNPKRSSTGYELNRLNMLLALLEKKIGIALNQYDVFVNIAGGIKISETAGDLAVVAAILSSFKDRVLSSDTIFIGEISLTGDIRDVQNLDARLKEAQNHNFTKAIVPRSLKDRSIKIKCFEASEVSKIVDWM